MALIQADRVKDTTTSTSTGAVTISGKAPIADQSGSNWEVGIGTYTNSTTSLSRDTVLASSNAGALVNFTAGTKDVFVTYPASRAIPQGRGLINIMVYGI